MTSVDPIIRRLARKYGLDERAVIAVALGEGGLTPGWHVGDRAGGGSYGPFQLYAQGALPQRFRGKPQLANRWAWSPQGIDYALRQMVKAGAGGLSGPQAVETIIRKFERPADPDKSVRLALSRYGGIQAGGAAPPEGPVRAQAIPSPSPGAAPGPDIGTLRSNVLTTLLAERRSGQSGRSASLAALGQLQQALAEPKPKLDPKGTVRPPRPSGGPIDEVIAAADSQIGKPYVFGSGPDTKSFDCSDLIQWAYKQVGVNLPRTTWEQIKVGKPVKWGQFAPGDLIFTNKGGHVVMYVGDGKVIAAPRTGTVVQYQPVSRFKDSFVAARRVIA